MFEYKYTYDKNYRKIKGHLHFTGKYRANAYSIYNTTTVYLKKILWLFTVDQTMMSPMARFMASLFSNLVDNPTEGIHKVKCKYEHDDKNAKREELIPNILSVFWNTNIYVAIKNTEKCLMEA